MNSETLVHIVDDDEAVRSSLSFLLGTAGFSVQLYNAALPFLEVLNSSTSGCVLTDVRMPVMNGIELLRRIKTSGYSMPVIIMTGHGEVHMAVEAMKLGAADFLEKPFDDAQLIDALSIALGRADPANAHDPFLDRIATLTSRERQVFDRLVFGESNKNIARNLDISPRTVEIYRANVMTKLQAESLSQLIRSAVRAGHA